MQVLKSRRMFPYSCPTAMIPSSLVPFYLGFVAPSNRHLQRGHPMWLITLNVQQAINEPKFRHLLKINCILKCLFFSRAQEGSVHYLFCWMSPLQNLVYVFLAVCCPLGVSINRQQYMFFCTLPFPAANISALSTFITLGVSE